MLLLIIIIWIALVPYLARLITASIRQQKTRHNYNMALAAEEAERKRIAAEKQAEEDRKSSELARKDAEKRRKELEKEKQKLASIERKQAEAQTIIDHYEPIRKELIERIKQLETEYYAAECSGKSGSALEKAKKPLDSAKEKLFQTERKLEKAYFIINQ